MYYIIVGITGLKAGISKSIIATKLYILMLLGDIVLEGILLYFFTTFYLEELICPRLKRDNNLNRAGVVCDEKFIQMVYFIMTICFIILSLIICIPTIMCPCKLQKYAEILKKGSIQSYQTMPAQSLQYSQVI